MFLPDQNTKFLILLDKGPLDGRWILLPKMHSCYYFLVETSEGKVWAAYDRKYLQKNAKPYSEQVKTLGKEKPFGLGSSKKKTKAPKNKWVAQAIYQFCRTYPETHCDVQTFLKWHQEEYGKLPETLLA